MKKTVFRSLMLLLVLACLSCTKDPQAPIHHNEDPSNPDVPSQNVQTLPYIQSFASEFGTYTVYNVAGVQSWAIEYQTAMISGYEMGTYYANEDWLISSPVAFTGVRDAKMIIEYSGYYFGDSFNNDVTVWASEDYTSGSDPRQASWSHVPSIFGIEYPPSTDFLTAEIPLTEFVGRTVTFAIKYSSTDSMAGRMEIRSIAIEEGSATVNQFFNVHVSANPTNGGIVTGSGTYQNGHSCTVMATANDGYVFNNWTENGIQVSIDANYTFTVTDNRTLVANFGFVSDNGSGTAEDPYNVAAGIGLQSEEPIAWVHGYIVGAVKSGISSVLDNTDINWTGLFDSATNVVIADDATCHEISQCIIVNLPAGRPLRTQVNLMDNPDNLGKHLAVNGKLRKYFGQAGLRDSNGTEADFVLEGGVIPPTPGTEIFSESFANGQGTFTIQDVVLPLGLTYVWQHTIYSCMKASAYYGQAYAVESWLVSPTINLSGVSNANLTFEQAVNYASPNGILFVMISPDYNGDVTTARWTELNLDQWPTGNDFTFITSAVDLTPYVGQMVTIAFKYTSTISANPVWEVKNFVVEE